MKRPITFVTASLVVLLSENLLTGGLTSTAAPTKPIEEAGLLADTCASTEANVGVLFEHFPGRVEPAAARVCLADANQSDPIGASTIQSTPPGSTAMPWDGITAEATRSGKHNLLNAASIWPADARIPFGQTGFVDVMVSGASEVDAYTFDFVFDSSKLEFVSVSKDGTLSQDFEMVGGNVVSSGRLRITGVAFLTPPASGYGTLLRVEMRAKTGPRASAAIRTDNPQADLRGANTGGATVEITPPDPSTPADVSIRFTGDVSGAPVHQSETHVTEINMNEGQVLTLNITAEDSAGRPITLTAEGTALVLSETNSVTFGSDMPSSLKTPSGTGTVTVPFVFKPGYAFLTGGVMSTTVEVVFRVSNGTLVAEETVHITVSDVERNVNLQLTPMVNGTVTSFSNGTITVREYDETLEVVCYAWDDGGGEPIALSASDNVAGEDVGTLDVEWIAPGERTSIYRFTPNLLDHGGAKDGAIVTITASNGRTKTVSQSFTVNISNTQRSPEAESIVSRLGATGKKSFRFEGDKIQVPEESTIYITVKWSGAGVFPGLGGGIIFDPYAGKTGHTVTGKGTLSAIQSLEFTPNRTIVTGKDLSKEFALEIMATDLEGNKTTISFVLEVINIDHVTPAPTPTPSTRLTATPGPTLSSTPTRTPTVTPTPIPTKTPEGAVAVYDNPGDTTGDLAGQTDFDTLDARNLTIHWNAPQGSATDWCVYVRKGLGGMKYLGHTMSGRATSLDWCPGAPGLGPEFGNGPDFNSAYTFRVIRIDGDPSPDDYFHQTGAVGFNLEGENPVVLSQPAMPNLGARRISIYDDILGGEDLAPTGTIGSDTDDPSERAIQIAWNFGVDPSTVNEYHVQVRVGNGDFEYLGQTGSGHITYFWWTPDNQFTTTAGFADGPQDGRTYQFRVILIPLSGTTDSLTSGTLKYFVDGKT